MRQAARPTLRRGSLAHGFRSASVKHLSSRAGPGQQPTSAPSRSHTRFLTATRTAGDFVSGYDANYWIGLGAPKKTPGEIVTRLNKEINAALATPDMQSRFAQQGGIVAGGSPSDFEKFISDETQKWSKVIKTANIKPE